MQNRYCPAISFSIMAPPFFRCTRPETPNDKHVPTAFAPPRPCSIPSQWQRELLVHGFGRQHFSGALSVDVLSACLDKRIAATKFKLHIADLSAHHQSELRRMFNDGTMLNFSAWIDSAAIEDLLSHASYRDLIPPTAEILKEALAENIDAIKLDVLRACFVSRVYVGLSCDGVVAVNAAIKRCHERSRQDHVYNFVSLFILLYSRGSLFRTRCENGCHSLDDDALQSAHSCISSKVGNKSGSITMSLELLDHSLCFGSLPNGPMESLLVDSCNDYVVSRHQRDNEEPMHCVFLDNFFKVLAASDKWSNLVSNAHPDAAKLIGSLIADFENSAPKVENVRLLDHLVLDLKIDPRFRGYLAQSSFCRDDADDEKQDGQSITRNIVRTTSFSAHDLLHVNCGNHSFSWGGCTDLNLTKESMCDAEMSSFCMMFCECFRNMRVYPCAHDHLVTKKHSHRN